LSPLGVDHAFAAARITSSAQMPRQNTMLGFVFIFVFFLSLVSVFFIEMCRISIGKMAAEHRQFDSFFEASS
jgi:hypothetical protein